MKREPGKAYRSEWIGAMPLSHGFQAADYLGELYYPGTVDIGTSLRHVGRSSFHLGHGIFHEGRCSVIATSVIVHARGNPLEATPLTDDQKRQIRTIAGSV